MARKTRHYRRRGRRGTIRRSKPHITAVGVIQGIIAVAPVATASYENYQKSGGGVNGIIKGILPTISTSYTGYNPNDGKFYPNDLAVGYVPLFGAVVAGKILRKVGILRRIKI